MSLSFPTFQVLTDFLEINLGDLSDTQISSITAGELIVWDGTDWVNQTLSEAGIASGSHTHTESDITDLGAYITLSDLAGTSFPLSPVDGQPYTRADLGGGDFPLGCD